MTKFYFTYVPRLVRRLYRTAIWTNPYSNELLWTFDDGPDPQSTPRILEILENHGVKAVFFCLGNKMEQYPELTEEITQRGHILASHGYEHIDPLFRPFDSWKEDFHKAMKLSGSELYRPPYGRLSFRKYRYVIQRSKLMLWTIMPGDFKQVVSGAKMLSILQGRKTQSNIVVLHDRPDTVDRIEVLIRAYYSSKSPMP